MKRKRAAHPLRFWECGSLFAGFGLIFGQNWVVLGPLSDCRQFRPVLWAVGGRFGCTLSEPQRATQSRFCGVAVLLYSQEQKPLRGAEMSSTEGKRKAHREPEPLNVGDGLRA